MKMSDAIQHAYNKKWSMINTFSITIDMPEVMADKVGGPFKDDLNIHVVSCQTPDITNTPIESYIGGQWRIYNGQENIFRFTITFRDHDSMTLYRKFYSMYKFSLNQFFDDCKMTVKITKDADWVDENEDGKLLLTCNNALIEALSNLDFNTTNESQIAEFTVSFKCTNITVAR